MVAAISNSFSNKYEVLGKLGQEGFVIISLAKVIGLGQKNPTFVTRFEKEAQTVAQFNHHNIAGVNEFGQEDGRFFIVIP